MAGYYLTIFARRLGRLIAQSHPVRKSFRWQMFPQQSFHWRVSQWQPRQPRLVAHILQIAAAMFQALSDADPVLHLEEPAPRRTVPAPVPDMLKLENLTSAPTL